MNSAGIRRAESSARKGRRGASLAELVVLMAILGIALGTAALYLAPMAAPVKTAGELVDGLIKQTRAKAMATTSARRIRPADARRLVVESAVSCESVSWTPDERMELELPDEVTLTDTSWSVCFNSRGTATDNIVLTFTHPRVGSRQLEVLLGGMVRWLS